MAAAGLEAISVEEYHAIRPKELNSFAKTERDLTKPVGPLNKPGNSTVQSIMRGSGSAETDHLNGEIVLLGRLFGIPTPVNAAVQRAMAVVAARQEGVGAIKPEDVLRLATTLAAL